MLLRMQGCLSPSCCREEGVTVGVLDPGILTPLCVCLSGRALAHGLGWGRPHAKEVLSHPPGDRAH